MAQLGIPQMAEPVAVPVERDPALTRIPPASFRGIDCSQLAAQYAAFRMLQSTAQQARAAAADPRDV